MSFTLELGIQGERTSINEECYRLFTIDINDKEARKLLLKKIEEKVNEVEHDLLFWDSKELKRRTCMSWNTIQKEFFFDKEFPKVKKGGKWYFPAEQTKRFLLQWLEQNRNESNEIKR